jgi:hypothetical protein
MPHCQRLLVLVLLLTVAACNQSNQPSEMSVSDDSKQTITSLSEADQKRLRDQRAAIEKYLGNNKENLRKYKTAAGKLGTIRAILQGGVFKPDQTYELQCLGVVLGDVFVQELGMEWVIVEDEHGSDGGIIAWFAGGPFPIAARN